MSENRMGTVGVHTGADRCKFCRVVRLNRVPHRVELALLVAILALLLAFAVIVVVT